MVPYGLTSHTKAFGISYGGSDGDDYRPRWKGRSECAGPVGDTEQGAASVVWAEVGIEGRNRVRRANSSSQSPGPRWGIVMEATERRR